MTATTPGRVPRRPATLPVEARSVQGRPAGAVTRTGANLVDSVVAVLMVGGGYGVWAAVRFLRAPQQFVPPSPSFAVLLICWLGALFLYFAFSWGTTGRTYGDHLLGLRVLGPRGGKPAWAVAILRAAACVVVPIGLYLMLFSATNKSLQDLLLRTSVVYDWSNAPRRTPAA